MALIIGSNGFIGSHMRAITEPGLICMAGISDTTFGNWPVLHSANVIMPWQLAADAKSAGVPFIYASSASVYGNGAGPLNDYARSKVVLDSLMWKCTGIWYGLRFFNVYGAGEQHKGEQASLVHRIAGGDLKRVFLPEMRRDFVHVSDCVAVARWLLRMLPPSGVYDVGTGVSRSIRELVVLTGAEIEWIDPPKSLKGKLQMHTQADLKPLRALGYSAPFKSLEEGIKLL